MDGQAGSVDTPIGSDVEVRAEEVSCVNFPYVLEFKAPCCSPISISTLTPALSGSAETIVPSY